MITPATLDTLRHVLTVPKYRNEIASRIEAGTISTDAARGMRWRLNARDEQLAPNTDWFVWWIRTGRGWGKNRTAAEYVLERIRCGSRRGLLVGATFAKAREEMVLGESGILAFAEDAGIDLKHNKQEHKLTHANGDIRYIGAEKIVNARGPNNDTVWIDEWCHHQYPREVLNQCVLTCRLPIPGDRARMVVTSTPLPLDEVDELEERPSTHVTTGSTHDNFANLDSGFAEEIVSFWEGTSYERQELYGDVVKEADGALWSQGMIEYAASTDAYDRIVVGIDPGDLTTGIVVAGRRGDDIDVLDDCTVASAAPKAWEPEAVRVANEWNADSIIAEANFGGRMVRRVLKYAGCDIPVKLRHASENKALRARPVSVLYQKQRVKHRQRFPKLERQMTTWTTESKDSPDRLDAMVWAVTALSTRGKLRVTDRRAY